MEPTLIEQTGIFFRSLLLGVILWAVYLLIAFGRVASPPGKWRLFAEDALFVFFGGVLNFLFALALTNGIVRFYVLAPQTVVFFLLYLTIGRWFLRCSACIIRFLTGVFHRVTDPIGYYFNNLSNYTVRSCQILLKKIKKIKK